ncbi:hypothetical protein KKG31_00650 [Patescibacteria group bacterium]|nr:hypothetical protein [Patescibacteria group bacterium]MBU1757694.1 hypothetical protein [Patescibacteria group bacterium]
MDEETKNKILEQAEKWNNQRPDDETEITEVEEELRSEEIDIKKLEPRKPKLLEIVKRADPELKTRTIAVLDKITVV